MITAAQKLWRRERLGSSDVAAILGLSPWRSAADVAMEKRGLVEEPPETAPQARGNRLEAAVLAFMESELELEGGSLMSDTEFEHPSVPLVAHPDGYFGLCKSAAGVRVVEAKTSRKGEDWGDSDDPDGIPAYYVAQCQAQMACIPVECVHLGVLLPFLEFRRYRIERDDKLIGDIETFAAEWWDKHVVRGLPCDDTLTPDVARRIRRVPNSIVEIADNGLAEKWRDAKDARRHWEDEVEKIESAIKTKMGTAEAARLPDGSLITYYPTPYKAYSVAATVRRTLRIKH